MTQQWSDDFNRADGPIGNGWSTSGSGVVIASAEVKASANRRVYRTPWSREPIQRVRFRTDSTYGLTSYAYPLLRWDDGAQNGYLCTFTISGTEGTVTIFRVTGGGSTSLGLTRHDGFASGYHEIEMVDDDGALSVLVDGVPFGTATDNTYTNNAGCGFRLPNSFSRVDDFYTDDAALAELDAEPEPLVQLAQAQNLTFTGTGTTWTPGTPGDPVFTVDKGTLENQTITSATEATADYTPPQADDVATFTDPSTGQTDEVALSTGFQVDAGGDNSDVLAVLGDPAPDADIVAILRKLFPSNNSWTWGVAQDALLTQILNIDLSLPWKGVDWKVTLGYNSMSDTRDLDPVLWAAVLGIVGNVLDGVIDVGTNVNVLTNNGADTLNSVKSDLKGTGDFDHTNLADLIKYISANSTVDLNTLLDELVLIHGNPGVSLQQVYDLLSTVAPPDLSPITDYLDFLTSDHTIALAALQTMLTTTQGLVNGVHDDLAADFSALTGAGARNLQQLYDLLWNVHDDAANNYTWLVAWANAHNTLMSEQYTNLHGHATNTEAQANAIKAVVDAIKAKTDTLQNTDLSAIVTQLNRIEAKIDALEIGSAIRVRPVWPGLTSVVLGAQQALAPSLAINGTMDGLLIHVEAQGPSIGTKAWEDTRSFYRLGYVTFRTDNGHFEPLQPLLFRDSLITPTTMQRASGCSIITRTGTVGTVRPWTAVAP